jgi:pilus assembly protein FimV
MGRKLATFILPAIVGYSSATLALGLGGVESDSYLNEPLDARIPLVSATAAELENLRVSLASPEAFERAGLSRPFYLSRLRFEIVTDQGAPYIRVTTAEPVKEPFLDFLVEAHWPAGRLLREYTILVDPPLYAAGTQAPAPQAAAAGGATGTPTGGDAGASAAAAVDAPARIREAAAAPAASAPASYGPVGASDTLWQIANEVRPEGVSVNQAMLALLRTNPDAFIDDNINRLRRGAVLRIPDRDEMTALSAAAATAEVRAQMERWRAARSVASEPPAENADVAAAESPAGDVAGGDGAMEGTDSHLTVVAPPESTGVDATASPQTDGGEIGEALDSRLALLEETNASLESENADLRAQVEGLKQDLARLESMINLQMQQSVPAAGDAGAATADAAGSDAPTDAQGAVDGAGAPEQEAEDPAPNATQDTEPAMAQADPATAAASVADTQPTPTAVDTEPATEAEPAPQAQSPRQSDLMSLLLQNAQLVAGGGAAVLLLLLLLVVRRRRGSGDTAADELEPMTAAVAGGAAVAAADSERTGDGAAGAAVSADEVPDGGALEAAEVFIALGNLERAQAALDEALGEDPDNRELRYKLLEVLAERGDRGGFEAEAQVFHTQVDAATDPHWQDVVAMGRRIAPEHPLFDDGTAVPESLPPEADLKSFDEAAADLAAGDEVAFDLTAEEDATPERRSEADAGADFDLDFSLDDVAPAATNERGAAPDTGVRPTDDQTDFDLDFVLDDADGPREEAVSEPEDRTDGDGLGLDFELPEDFAVDPQPSDRTAARADDGDDMTLDFGDPEMAQPAESESDSAQEEQDENFDLDALDEAGTKLDLARAYIDMGDAEGARSLLEEVISEGSSHQRQEAENLLRRAG